MDSIKAQNEVADQDNTHQPLNARNDTHHQQPSTFVGQSQSSESNPFLEADNDNSNNNDLSNKNAFSGVDHQKASERRVTPQLSSTPTPVHEPLSPTHAASHTTAPEFLQVDGSNITLFSTLSPTHDQQDESQQQFEQSRSTINDSEATPFTFTSTSDLPQASSTLATSQTPQSFSNTSTQELTSAEAHAKPTTADMSTTSTKGYTPGEHESLKSKLEYHLPGHHETSAHSTTTTHTGQHEGLVEKITKHLPGHDKSKVDQAKLQEQIKQGDIPPPQHFDWAEALRKEGFEHDKRLFAQHPEPIPIEKPGHHEAGAGGQHAPTGHFEAQSSATGQPEASGMQTQSRTAEEGLGLGRSTQPLASTQQSEEEFQQVAMHLGGSGQVDEGFGSRELNSLEYQRDSSAYPSSKDTHMHEGAVPLATLKSSHGAGSQFVHDGSAPSSATSSLPTSSVPYDRSTDTDAFSTTTAPTTSTTAFPSTGTAAPTTSSSTTTGAHTSPLTTSAHTSSITSAHTSPLTTSAHAPSTPSEHTSPATSAHTSSTTSAHTSPTTSAQAAATASAHTSPLTSTTSTPSTTSTHTAPHTSHDTTSTADEHAHDEHAHGLRAKLKHLKDKLTGHHDSHDVEGPSTVHKGPIEAHKDKPSTTAATDPPHPAQAVTQDTKHHFKIPHILYHPPKGRDLDAEKRANIAAAEESMKEMAQIKLAGAEKFEQFWDTKNKEAEANKAAGITPPPGQMVEGPGEGEERKETEEKQADSNKTSTPATSAAADQQSATNAALPVEQQEEGIKRQGVSEDNASIPVTSAGANQSVTTATQHNLRQQQQTSAIFPTDQQRQDQQSGLGIEQLPLEAGRLLHPQVEAVLAPSRDRPLLGQNCETPAIQTRDTPLLGAGCAAPTIQARDTPLLGAGCAAPNQHREAPILAPRSTDQATEDSTLHNQANASSAMHQSSRGVQAGERFGEYTSTPELVIHASQQAHHLSDANFPTSTSSADLPTSSPPSGAISPLSQPPLRRMDSRDDSAPVPLEPSTSSELDTTSPLSKPALRRLSSQVIPSAESLANLNAAQTPSAVEHQQSNTSSNAHLDRSANDQFSTPVHHMRASDFQSSPLPTISVAVMRPATQMPGEQVPLTEAHQQATSHGLQLAPSIHEQQRTSFSQPASSSANLAPTTAFRLEPEAAPVEPPPIKVSDYNFGTTFREPKPMPTEDDSESGLKGKVVHVAHAVKDVLKGGHIKTLSDVPTDDGSGHSKVPNPGIHVVAHEVPRD